MIKRHVGIGRVDDLVEQSRKYLVKEPAAPRRLVDKGGAFAKQERVPVRLTRIAEAESCQQRN
jgi:hypothetical protein